MSEVSSHKQDDLLTEYGMATTAYLLMAMSIDSLGRKNRQLEAENTKLREVVADGELHAREILAENAKLVDVLHEVETEAVYAYHCLQQDFMTTSDSSEHFFKKWWHAECELDRLKAENAILRDELEMVGTAAYLYGRDDLKADNDKLRELCAGLWSVMWSCAEQRCPHRHEECFVVNGNGDGPKGHGECWYEQRMRELGVEV